MLVKFEKYQGFLEKSLFVCALQFVILVKSRSMQMRIINKKRNDLLQNWEPVSRTAVSLLEIRLSGGFNTIYTRS